MTKRDKTIDDPTCDQCHGSGAVDRQPCGKCEGSGRVIADEPETVKPPAKYPGRPTEAP